MQAGRRTWRQEILFPGVVSLVIMAEVVFTGPVQWVIGHILVALGIGFGHPVVQGVILFSYFWPSFSMAVAYLAKIVERESGLRRCLSVALLYVAGYGALLCAITLAADVKEIRKADSRWEKTDKVGSMIIPG